MPRPTSPPGYSADIAETRDEIRDAFRHLETVPISLREVALVRQGLLEGGAEFSRGFREGFRFAIETLAHKKPPPRLKGS